MSTTAVASSALAVNGGTPVFATAPFGGWPQFGAEEEELLLLQALLSGVWGSIDGTFVKQFEVEFAELHAARHRVTVVNATMGLAVACRSTRRWRTTRRCSRRSRCCPTCGTAWYSRASQRVRPAHVVGGRLDFRQVPVPRQQRPVHAGPRDRHRAVRDLHGAPVPPDECPPFGEHAARGSFCHIWS